MEPGKTVIINGRIYDALTGFLIGDAPVAPKTNIAKSTKGATISTAVHQTAQKSTTLRRNYLKKTTPVNKSVPMSAVQKKALEDFRRRHELAAKRNEEARLRILSSHKKQVIAPIQHPQSAVAQKPIQRFVPSETPKIAKDIPATTHPTIARVNSKVVVAQSEKRHLTTKELKDKAIKEALERAATANIQQPQTAKKRRRREKKEHFWQRSGFVGVFSMSMAIVLLFGYLVYLNLPNISIRVAAMRAGIDAAYPSYQPSGYSLKGLVSYRDNSVEIKYSDTKDEIKLNQQKSSWDSVAVLNNYVKPNWGSSYATTKEKGLTIYIGEGKAAWVNGGILYTIEGTGDLTSEQLRQMAISL